MAKISLSGQEKSIEFIFSWYEDQIEALNDFKNKVITAVLYTNPSSKVKEKFIALTFDEINAYFDDSKNELEHLVCLNIISATEAFLRVDYNKRIKERDKSPVGRDFRLLNRKKGNKISLEDDIIETWKNNEGDKSFSDFLGLLKYRHWLAHGRYWKPKLGRRYSFDIAYEISETIFDVISKQN